MVQLPLDTKVSVGRVEPLSFPPPINQEICKLYLCHVPMAIYPNYPHFFLIPSGSLEVMALLFIGASAFQVCHSAIVFAPKQDVVERPSIRVNFPPRLLYRQKS